MANEEEDAQIIDLGEFRRKKMEKAKGIDTSRHPTRRVAKGSVKMPENYREMDFNDWLNEHKGKSHVVVDLRDSKSTAQTKAMLHAHNAVSTMSDSEVHAHAAQHGHIPERIDILDMPNIDYNALRAKLIMDPSFWGKFLK